MVGSYTRMNSLLAANLSCLRQGISFLESLPEPLYSRPCNDLFESSIGTHMRHNLDHFACFVLGVGSGRIDYDARKRNECLETNPAEAIILMEWLLQSLQLLEGRDLGEQITICMDDGGESAWSSSSLRRELQFLLSHTIHHYALIVAIATRHGHRQFPENFGIAPSTIHHLAAEGA